ncbi:hypothetical protein AURDEDRAFT_124686 [Auricularia subglabra TFB-10046 SS5]|nr:hypothetical protein AURDEDRAFT_124686 [Auricularia subglabra TFB-10046 SS5]
MPKDTHAPFPSELRVPRTPPKASGLPAPTSDGIPALSSDELEQQRMLIKKNTAYILEAPTPPPSPTPSHGPGVPLTTPDGTKLCGEHDNGSYPQLAFAADRKTPAPDQWPAMHGTVSLREQIIRDSLERPAMKACYGCRKTFAGNPGRKGHWEQVPACEETHKKEVFDTLRSDEYHRRIEESEKFVFWAPPPYM